ncbi:MAG: cupin domain-containing protein [Actinomycetota bacterium]|nr:cupin domain-containing protein [Actinomycetota bacterium]
MANIFEPHFDEPREHPGFDCRRARIGRQAGAERLGASVWDVPPGRAAYPYHFHHAEEELLFVLGGRPSLRTPDGWRDLEPGETVAFPVGERGAHQLVNRTEQTVRLLVVSLSGVPEICVYPDSDKIGVYDRSRQGGGLRELYRRADAVDYYDGEVPPPI